MSEPLISDWIGCALFVERPVRLDDQPSGKADEVDKVGTERDLTAELQIVQSSVPQQAPQPALIEGGLVAHASGVLAQTCGRYGHKRTI